MLLKLLGMLDLAAAIILILLNWSIGINIGWFFSIYLILKGIVFWSLASLLDILSGILMILAIFGYYSIFTWLAVVWLAQKFFFSYSNL